MNNGTSEIETESQYIFKLLNELYLTSSSIIEISFATPVYLTTSSTCVTTIGSSCVFGTNNITIYDPYPEGNQSPYRLREFVITGIINPNNTYLYSLIKFNIIARATDTSRLVYTDGMKLESSVVDQLCYTPHIFDSVELVAQNYSTIVITHYNFSFVNKDHPIPEGYFIRVNFPNGMKLTEFPPPVNIYEGLNNSISVPDYDNNYMVIEGAMGTEIAANTNCKFQVEGLQNPYEMTNNMSFGIKIYASIPTEPYFESKETEFSVNIDTISPFTSFQVTPLNLTVGEYSRFNISFKLGDGNLIKNHYVKLKVPNSIKYCKKNSLELTKQDVANCGNNFIQNSKKYEYSENVYGYKSYRCTNYNGTTIQFYIMCRNPESIRTTGPFILQVQSNKSIPESIYYLSSGSEFTPTEGTFIRISMTKLNEWLNYRNTFTFSIERRDPNNTAEINQISITFPPSLSIYNYPVCPTIRDMVGISAEAQGIGVNCSIEGFTINSILSLEQKFGFTVNRIMNPNSPTEPIYFNVATEVSGGYIGEVGITNLEFGVCAHPCLLCSIPNTAYCTSCYSEDNAIFDGGTSLHMLHLNSSTSTCVNSCSTHTFFTSATSCTECDDNCELCDLNPTNCTKCYMNTFLHNNECITSPCPAGYSDNVDKWICQEIRGLESETDIIVMDDQEVEKPALYRFILKPEGDLMFTDSNIDILSPEIIGVESTCQSTPGICSNSGSLITITNFLGGSNYKVENPPIVIDIYETYTNPNSSHKYSKTEFTIKAKINNTIYYSIILSVGEDDDDGRYAPHALGGVSIQTNSTTTVALATITFTLENVGFTIPFGHVIIVTLPPQMGLVGSLAPVFNHLDTVSLERCYIQNSDYPTIQIAGGFEGGLPPNSLITFSLDNILNAYGEVITDSFKVDIAPATGSALERQFTVNTELTLEMTNINEFSSFDVKPTSYMTSDISTYIISLKLGNGALTTDHKITIKFPQTVKNCEKQSISAIEGLTSPIINKYYSTNNDKYSFDIPSNVSEGTLIKVGINCQNPETTKRTGNIIVTAKVKDNLNAFYQGKIKLQMEILNNFKILVVTMLDIYSPPLENNTYIITVQRTATYTSTHLDQLEITIPENMNISSITCNFEYGIYSDTPPIYTTIGQLLNIKGIKDFSHEFKLVYVGNPPGSTDDIKFGILTGHSDGDKGEEGETNTLHILCDFACRTCVNNMPTKCLSCTLLFPGYYLFFDDRCDTCPKYTYFETAVRDCWRIYIYIYINIYYIACDLRCDECTGPTYRDCVTCSLSSAVFLNPITNYCECQIGYFPDPSTGECFSMLNSMLYL